MRGRVEQTARHVVSDAFAHRRVRNATNLGAAVSIDVRNRFAPARGGAAVSRILPGARIPPGARTTPCVRFTSRIVIVCCNIIATVNVSAAFSSGLEHVLHRDAATLP